MSTMTRRKAMTVDSLRDQLKTTMNKQHRRGCPNCNGTGQVSGPLGIAEIARQVGVTPHLLSRFLNGKGVIALDKGLALVTVLERYADPLSVLDDDEDRDEDEADPGLLGRREAEARQAASVRSRVLAAAATTSIDSINRPVVPRS